MTRESDAGGFYCLRTLSIQNQCLTPHLVRGWGDLKVKREYRMHSSVTDCSDVMLTVVLLLLEYFFHSAFSVQLFSGNKELDPVCSSHCCQQEETHGLRHAQYHLYTCICVVFSPLCSVPPQVCGRWVFFLNLPSTLRSF